jgi:hypothetical protein
MPPDPFMPGEQNPVASLPGWLMEIPSQKLITIPLVGNEASDQYSDN